MIRLGAERPARATLALGRGVEVDHRPVTFADLAVARAAGAQAMIEALRGLDDMDAEARADALDRAAALEAEASADKLATLAIVGWRGVTTADGAPAPFDLRTWRAFRDAAPALALALVDALRRPAEAEAAEGNASAASPAGGGAAA